MIWFLGNIAERIAAVSFEGVECSAGPMKEGARVIGFLPDELKRLYILLGEASERRKRSKGKRLPKSAKLRKMVRITQLGASVQTLSIGHSSPVSGNR